MNRLPTDPVFMAALDLVARAGAGNLTIGYVDDQGPPTVWWARVEITERTAARGQHVPHGFDVAAGLDPKAAVLRLLDQLVDGGTCAHCGRPSGIEVAQGTMPLAEHICWYQYDPELRTFRRGCE